MHQSTRIEINKKGALGKKTGEDPIKKEDKWFILHKKVALSFFLFVVWMNNTLAVVLICKGFFLHKHFLKTSVLIFISINCIVSRGLCKSMRKAILGINLFLINGRIFHNLMNSHW